MKALEKNDCFECRISYQLGPRQWYGCNLSEPKTEDGKFYGNKPGPKCPFVTIKALTAKIAKLEAREAELVEALKGAVGDLEALKVRYLIADEYRDMTDNIIVVKNLLNKIEVERGDKG